MQMTRLALSFRMNLFVQSLRYMPFMRRAREQNSIKTNRKVSGWAVGLVGWILQSHLIGPRLKSRRWAFLLVLLTSRLTIGNRGSILVEKVLSSWRQRSLSFKGKALVINPLALSRVWYVASLIHMPDWLTLKLVRLALHFF